MIVLTLLKEDNCLTNGNGIFQKVMEKVMESHGILRGQVYQPCYGNSTNFILM